LFTSGFTAPSYNFPLFLFGIYTQERSESGNSPKVFSGLLILSAILDFIWFFRHEQSWFIKAVSILILVLKVPTFFASHRAGGAISFPGGGGGETVWSMPGGFSSGGTRGGYQAFGDDLEAAQPPAPPTHNREAAPPPAQSPAPPAA